MKEKEHRRSRGTAGFTLIEILLVVAIIGMLAAMGILALPGRQRKAMINATRGKIANICTAIDVYEIDTGRYPASLGALVSDDGSANWQGPYVKGGTPVDAWGRDFQYESTATSYKITSDGPDEVPGTGDDITSF